VRVWGGPEEADLKMVKLQGVVKVGVKAGGVVTMKELGSKM